MGQPPTTRQAVFEVLIEHGPLHVAAIAEILQMDQRTVQSAVRIAHERKLLHISGWKRSFGTRGRWGAIYCIGPGQDRKPPEGDMHKQANKRYREKYREVLRRRMRARRGKPVDPWIALLGKL
jgi:hypothetical protein